jgi:succinate dehydrogenase/fumarate reductase flavoprotein subunit
MIRQGIDGKTKRAYFIADHRATRKYGLGAARPAPIPLGPYLRSQYITKAANLRELASKLNLPEQVLVEEVMRFNESAAVGTDPIFKRGASSYNKFQGDYSHKPNPCLAPITQPPFYGVEVYAGDLGTFLGLQVGPVGEVMDVSGAPIPGLYAIGNDASNVFSGACLGGGVTIGPAMVFGYIAGKAIGDS